MMDAQREQFSTWLREHGGLAQRIAVLTGAGISAESGIPTFRGRDGVWRGMEPSDLFTPEALAANPRLVWEMYDELRQRIRLASPNAGHHALAHLAATHTVTIATQNIDGLHQRAGSDGVLELHGTLWHLRCEECGYFEANDQTPLPLLPPHCPQCHGLLRPDIVLFSEPLPKSALAHAWQAVERCDLMLVVGTSGVVYPAAGLPAIARASGALVVEVNPVDTALTATVDYVLRAPAAVALPWVVEVLRGG